MVAVTIISDMSELIYGTDHNLIYWHVAILGKKKEMPVMHIKEAMCEENLLFLYGETTG